MKLILLCSPFQTEVGNELEAQLNIQLTPQGPLKRIQTPPTIYSRTFQVALVVKNPPANAGDIRNTVSLPRSERSPGEGNSNPLQYSCLENPTDGGAWWATVHGVAKSRTRLNDFTFTFKEFMKTRSQSLRCRVPSMDVLLI